ncbi:cysteine proteinase [Hysterangium stoloniferum]|nr:cysteine proteinase [Hysterangium stoloniferum]
MSLLSDLAAKLKGVQRPAPETTPVPQTKTNTRIYQQEAFRAGLLVTDQFDKAITKCQTKVEELAEECRSRNRKFRDIEFDLGKDQDQCLHSLSTPDDEKFKPADVLRVSEIFDNPQFFIDGTQSSDIVQGRLGDCWFLCAVATLSSMPGLIEKVCVARDEKVGIYGFIFCRDGEWVDVIIDDQLFTSVPKYETLVPETQNLYHKDKNLYDKVARRGSKTLYFAKSAQENETWVPLLEKAFAKLHGDYAALIGGFAFQALEDLTGGVSQVIFTNDIYDIEEFWHNDLMRATKDRLFGCYLDSLAGKGAATDNTTTEGLVSSHAYSILAALEYNGKRFLKIRNPWGQGEWNGRWSDGSKEWTKEWLPALDRLDHQFGDDGCFIMEYSDFLKTWYAVERTQLFDDSWIQSSHWLNITSRSFPCAWQYGDVSFSFTISESSPSIIMLSQADFRYWNELSGYSIWVFDFVLYKKGSQKVLGRSESSVQWPRSVTLIKYLDEGDYVLHVRLDRNYQRQKDYVRSNLSKWDHRKLGRVWGEAAKSMTMASNYDHKAWRSQMAVSPESFAGRDLLQLEIESFQAATEERKSLKARFFPTPAKITVTTQPTAPPSPSDTAVAGDTLTNDTPGAISAVSVETKTEEAGATVGIVVETAESAPAHPIPQPTSGATGEGEVAARGVDDIGGLVENGLTVEIPHPLSLPPSVAQIEGSVPVIDGVAHPDELVSHPVICDGCRVNPVIGPRYNCLVCYDYDLCDACHLSGAHPPEHQMLRIETPADAEDLDEPALSEGEDNTLLMGLRVYTKTGAKVNISGQLRHGRLISWRKQK